MWILCMGMLFMTDVEQAPKIRQVDEISVRLGIPDGLAFQTTADVAIAGSVDYYKSRRPKAEHLSAKAVVLIPDSNSFGELASQDCKLPFPQDETNVQFHATLMARSGWPPGDAILRVYFYDTSKKTVTLRASDTVFITFVPREDQRASIAASLSRFARSV